MAPKSAENLTREEIQDIPKMAPRKYEIVWLNICVFLYYHVAAMYGLYICVTKAMWVTIGYSVFLYWLSAVGVTAGAHRLWSHRSYKATLPLQVFLMLCHSLANQHTVLHWVSKIKQSSDMIFNTFPPKLQTLLTSETTDCIINSDTDADPHNARRGFFYSHIGWLLVRKLPLVKEKGKQVDLSDIQGNPVLRFQERHANWLIIATAFILPSVIPIFWKESFSNAYHLNMLRYVILLNATFLINSAAHSWGYRPYDKSIMPRQSVTVSAISLGEGFHNFHHVFPFDYRCSELGNIMFNSISVFIDVCAYFGLVYDRREAAKEVVEARMKRTGDGRDLWCRMNKTALRVGQFEKL